MKIETIHDMKVGSGKFFTPKEAEALVKHIQENMRPVPDEPERGKNLIMPRRLYEITIVRDSDGGSIADIFEESRLIASIRTPLSRNVASGMALRSLYWFLAKRDKKNRSRREQRKRAKAAKREAKGGVE